MAASSLLAHATRFLAVVLVAGSLAACANDQNSQTAQLTGKDGSVTPGTHRDFSVNVGDIVYFTTDSSELTPEATATLQKQAVWLQQYPQYTITIEGHADERGTNEYNLALGERRSRAVQEYLASFGVGTTRLSTLSYGEEKPAQVGSDEAAWAKNRRAEFTTTF